MDLLPARRRIATGSAAAGVLAAGVLAACATTAPRLVAPERIEASCPAGTPRGPAITSILSAVADAVMPVDVPPEVVLRQKIRNEGGVFASWTDQPLYMPGTAKALEVSGTYIDVVNVAITNDLAGPDYRIIYVTIKVAGGTKRVALRSYDVRNVCTSDGSVS